MGNFIHFLYVVILCYLELPEGMKLKCKNSGSIGAVPARLVREMAFQVQSGVFLM